MKALANRRARITRVREVLHLQAASEAATAENKVVQLEGNAARLSSLRASLSTACGPTSGAALGSSAELAQRLDTVGSGLRDAICAARTTAEAPPIERLEANIARESAERLQHRAVAAMHRMIEERMIAGIRPRNARSARNG